MASWSGLYDDVHGTPYAVLGTPIPVSRKFYREAQKRGNYSVTKNIESSDGTGMTVPTSRSRVQAGSDLGGLRTIESANTVGAVTDAQAQAIFSATLKHTYVVDKSGNGGAAY